MSMFLIHMAANFVCKLRLHMYIKVSVYSIVLLALVAVVSCSNSTDKSMSFKSYLETHKYAVGQTSFVFVDSLRNRPLKTEVWYPTLDTTQINSALDYPFILPPTSLNADCIPEKLPLVLLSHGTGGNRISQMWLAVELAGNGYVVASVDHFGNTLGNKIPQNFVKIWDRPLDMSYILTKLLQTAKFNSVVDTTTIGMAGFSLGGYTTIALAGGQLDYQLLKEFSKTQEGKAEFDLPELGDISGLITPEIISLGDKEYKDLKDDRISAFVAMAPAIGQGFNDEAQFTAVKESVLIFGAQNDDRTPVHTNARHYHGLMDGSKYIELPGQVGHYVFMNQAKSGLTRNAPIVFKDDSSVNRKEVHQQVVSTVVAFFNDELGVGQ